MLYDVKKNLTAQIPSKSMVYKQANKTYTIKMLYDIKKNLIAQIAIYKSMVYK